MDLINWLFGPPTRDQFASLVMRALRDAGDLRQHRYEKDQFRLLNAGAGEINLGNVYQEHCKLSSAERPAHLKQIAQVFSSAANELPEEFDEAKKNLRPKIWPRAVYANLELRQRLNNGKPLDSPLYPLGSHLVTTVVYDLPTSMRSLSNEDLEKWGVTYYEAMEIACQNLQDTSIAFSRIGDRFHSAVSGDNYDSARILLKDLVSTWDVLGDPVSMVPQRDAMYVTGSDDEIGLKMMIDLTEMTLNDEVRPLSPFPLKLVDGEWEDWTFPEVHESYPKFRSLENRFMFDLYAEQKPLLEAIYEKEKTDDFVASFSGLHNKSTGDITSYCAWAKDCTSLLPKTDLIMIQVDDGTAICKWDRVARFAKNLLEPVEDLYPIRYRVSQTPTAEQLDQIGRVEL